MKDMMEYKDYIGSVHYSNEDEIFYGKVEFIRDLVSYEGKDVKSLKRTFQESLDDYLTLCEKQGKEPERPFKGSFNIRAGSDLHRQIAVYAQEHQLNLNQVVIEALNRFLTTAKA